MPNKASVGHSFLSHPGVSEDVASDLARTICPFAAAVEQRSAAQCIDVELTMLPTWEQRALTSAAHRMFSTTKY